MLHMAGWMSLAMAAMGALFVSLRAFALLRERGAVAARFRFLAAPVGRNGTWSGRAMDGLERAGRLLAPKAQGSEVQRLLLQAGCFAPSAPYVFAALRVALATTLGAGAFLLRRHGEGAGPSGAAQAAMVMWFGYRLSVTGLKIAAERRARIIRRELPHAIDVVLLVLDSGVSIDQSLRYAAGALRRTAPAAAAILARYVADIETGLAYDIALDRMGNRFGIEEGLDLASLVKQALFQGGELGQALRRFAVDLMDGRVAAAREQIGRRSTQLTLVMLVFFMPVLFIVLGGPAVSQLSTTLGHVARDTRHQDMRR
jgi:tight adherence protein C